MKWDIEEVISVLSNEKLPNLGDENELALQLFDAGSICGIGIDNLGRRVLVLPGQSEATSFLTKNAIFDPWNSVTWANGTQQLPKVATLRCEANFKNRTICEVVAAIFVGLIDIQNNYGSASAAIWEMKRLFEDGFNSSVSEDILVGLFGELIVISCSPNPANLINYWHSNSHDYFDFSSEAHRLEVKTSRSNLRNHRFSSNQIGEDLDSRTTVASVILRTVEKGMTLTSLVEKISRTLDLSHSAKLVNLVIATLGVPPQLANSIQIDFISSQDTIRLYSGVDVPRPTKTMGVISMNWIANMETVPTSPLSLDALFELF